MLQLFFSSQILHWQTSIVPVFLWKCFPSHASKHTHTHPVDTGARLLIRRFALLRSLLFSSLLGDAHSWNRTILMMEHILFRLENEANTHADKDFNVEHQARRFHCGVYLR